MSYDLPWTSLACQVRTAIRIDVKYPSALTLIFTDLPVFDSGTDMVNVGAASVGMAIAFSMQSFSINGGDSGDITLAIRNVRYRADNNTTAGAFTDLVDLMASYMLHGATVTIKQYGHAPNNNLASRILLDGSWTNDDSDTEYGATVENVTNVTAHDITLAIAQNSSLDNTMIPSMSVGTKDRPTSGGDCPEISKGLAVPVRMGEPYFYPYNWETFYKTYSTPGTVLKIGAPYCGITPARLYEKESVDVNTAKEELRWSHCEYPPYPDQDINVFGNASSPSFEMVEYIPQLDAFGVVSTDDLISGSMDVGAKVLGHFLWSSRRRRKMSVFLIPKEVSYISGGVTNPSHAIDRKLDTYMTLSGTAAEARFRIPQVGNLGTIRPSDGLYVFVITRSDPPGNTGAGGGNFWLGMKEPLEKPAGTWQFSPGYTTVYGNTNGYQFHTLTSSGWVGTQFQQWEFSASGTSDTNDGNSRVYVGSQSYAGYPFDVVIQKFGGVAADRLYVVAVGLAFSFIKDIDDYVPYVRKESSGGRRRLGISYIKPWTGTAEYHGAQDYNVVTGRPLPPREKSPAALPRYVEPDDTVDPEGVYGIAPGFYDPDDRYGGGVGWISKPGSIIAFLAKHYTKPQTGFTVGVSTAGAERKFGTVRTFNAICDLWALTASGAWNPFRLHNVMLTDKASADETIRRILAECPGGAFRTISTGYPTSLSSGRPALTTTYHDAVIPADEPGGNQFESLIHPCATNGILPVRDIAMANGRLGVEIVSSAVRDVVNDLEIHYQYDPITRKYGRIASCNSAFSDDGYGGGWPDTPSGSTSVNLCAISEQCFGKQRKVVIKLQYVWDRWSALAYAISYLWMRWRPQWTVRFVATQALQDLTPGLLILFNDELANRYGLRCPVMGRGTSLWGGYYWRVVRVDRMPGNGRFYNVYAEEHYNDVIGGVGSGLSGGPVLTPGGEGFDQ